MRWIFKILDFRNIAEIYEIPGIEVKSWNSENFLFFCGTGPALARLGPNPPRIRTILFPRFLMLGGGGVPPYSLLLRLLLSLNKIRHSSRLPSVWCRNIFFVRRWIGWAAHEIKTFCRFDDSRASGPGMLFLVRRMTHGVVFFSGPCFFLRAHEI